VRRGKKEGEGVIEGRGLSFPDYESFAVPGNNMTITFSTFITA